MKKLLLGVLSLVILVAIAAVAVPFFVPVDVYKEQITVAAKDATGRELVIGGDVGLSIFPRLELHAEDVTFSNMPRGRARHMASLDELVVRLQLMPLLSGEVRIDSFVLVNPVIALEIDGKGRTNWAFESAAPTAPEDSSAESSGEPPALTDISLGDVRLVNGKVSYRDARAGDVTELKQINMAVALPSLDAAAEADGSVVWNGKKVSLEVTAENPRALMDGASSALTLALSSEPISLDFQGTAKVSEPLNVAGNVSLDVPSIRRLAAWVGAELDAPGDGLGPLSIAGELTMKGAKIAFKKAKIGLDGMTASGDFRVDTGTKVLYLKGRLDWDALDLNLYTDADATKATAADDTSSDGPGDWSDDPIDFNGLKSVNADFDLSVKSITLDRMKFGQSAVKIGLKNGRLAVDLKKFELYGGNGTANLVLNARGKVPLISEKINFTGIQLEPLLTDAAGFDKMSGQADIKMSINTHGRTERQLVAGLNGNGAVSSTDGAIRGVNLGEMVRNAASAFLGKAEREQAKTDYAELRASFTLRNGVLSNRDLSLAGPHVAITGAGTSDLNRRTIKYRVVPKALAASTAPADGTGAGITVPVLVDGPWHDPRFRPDLASLITETAKDPKQAVKAAKKTFKAIKKEGLGGLLQSLGQPPAPAPAPADGSEPAPAPQNGDPRKLLKGLFGG